MARGQLYAPATVGARLKRAVLTRPTIRDLVEFLIATAVLAVVFGPLGFSTGLLVFDPQPPGVVAVTALIALFIPALGEELPFRGVLIPDRTETGRATGQIVISTLIFVLWHLVERAWQPEHWSLFSRPDFLAWAGGLGLACAILRRRSGSIWTAVALHWIAVVVWIGWLGGPSF
jgi:predicted Abi (CAAX) family protease